MLIKQESVETSEVVEMYQSHPLSIPASEAEKKECKLPKKKKAEREYEIVGKIAMKKKRNLMKRRQDF